MAYDEITVQLPAQEAEEIQKNQQSVEVASFEKTTVVPANGIKINNALDNKNNSLVIVAETSAAANVIIKAGDNYPNRMLGDCTISAKKDEVCAIILEDISRFENRDGSICIEFGSGFSGTIYAVAKRVGLRPVA